MSILGCATPVRSASDVLGQQVAVPSGQRVYLSEVLQDETPGALWLRFRFVAPDMVPGTAFVDPESAAADMDHLCQSVALSYLTDHKLMPERISISLEDRAIPFGNSDPDTLQFFELYSPPSGGQGTSCMWEAF